MTPLLAPLVLSALTFTTHFPLTRATPSYAVSNGVVYAVNRGVLYRSGDGGAAFEERGSVTSDRVVVDSTNADIVYDPWGGRRSDDGGATWKQFGTGFSGNVAISPVNPAEIRLFGSCSSSHPQYSGVFVSTDRGDTWQHETSECTLDLAMDPLPPHTIYRAGLFHSGSGLPTRQIVADPNAWQFRYGLNTYDTNAILVSATGGLTWEQRAMPDRVWRLALDGGRLFAARATGLYLSTDGAESWQKVIDGTVTNVVVDGNRLYIATPASFFHAPLATLAPFTPVAELPRVPMSVRGLAADPHAPRLYATAEEGVWRSDDGGEHWQPINGDDTTRRGAVAIDGAGDVYAFDDTTIGLDQTADLFHYDAVSGNVEHFASDIELPLGRTLWADPNRRGVLYTTKYALLYKSADGGHTWTLVASLNDGTKWIAIASVAFSRDAIYAATDAGLYRSLDAGTTWTALDQQDTSRIAVGSHTIYRTGSHGLARSDDGGTTWIPLTSPASGNLTIDPLGDRSLWASRNRDLYHSADGGATWTFEASLPEPILTIAVDAASIHVLVDGAPGEFDAVIRHERRRAARR